MVSMGRLPPPARGQSRCTLEHRQQKPWLPVRSERHQHDAGRFIAHVYVNVACVVVCESVVAVDRSKDVLTRGRDLAKRRKLTNITWKRGELERLPIADTSIDIALISGDMRHYESRWNLYPVPETGGTRIVFSSRLMPGFYVPGMLGTTMIRGDIERMMAAVLARIDSQYADKSS